MSKPTIELSPQVKGDFETLCRRLTLDKATQLRSIYIFEEFVKKRAYSAQQVDKTNFAVYLRVSALIASKTMSISTVDGQTIRGYGLSLSNFVDRESFRLAYKSGQVHRLRQGAERDRKP